MDVNNDDDHFVAYLRNCFRLSQYWRLLISEALPSASSLVINTCFFLNCYANFACCMHIREVFFGMVAPSLVDSIFVESRVPLLKGGAVRYFKPFARSMMSFPEIKPQSNIKLPISQSNVDIYFNTRLCTQVSVFSLSKLVDWKSGHDGDLGLVQTPHAD